MAVALAAAWTPAAAGLAGAAPAPLAKARVAADPRIVDRGVAAPSDVKRVTLSLAVRNKAALDAFAAAVADPRSPSFRKFITPAQFAAAYGQPAAAVAQAVAYLQSRGFAVTRVHAGGLLISATATNAQLAAVFGSAIHTYALGASSWQAPAAAPVLPAALAGIATGVAGLSTRPPFRSHAASIPRAGALAGDAVLPASGGRALAAGTPGEFTVRDLAAKYDIDPLYAKGLTGAGRTLGIATLAGYRQSDAFAYWDAVGLSVDPGRITDVPVDGGPLPADGPGTLGAGETTLDVEQSGGVAPGAAIRVYLAPNTDAGFLDVFAQAIDENLVDVLSVSWGSAEIDNDGATLAAYDTLFEQAAVQGIPVIAASGDSGAFDVNGEYPYPDCTTLVSVDFPASDPNVLAAGGTTLPHTFVHTHGPVTVPTERAWGWDYLRDYIVTYYGNALYYSDYFTVGGGGGVSVDFAKPAFQSGLAGTAVSAPAQSLLCSPAALGVSGTQYLDLVDMPSGVAGRNLPDVSLNADPYSGYLVYQDGAWSSGNGGTSFVAPQLNGLLTLISSGLGGRIGPVNPQLYAAFKAQGYGAGSPFRPIASGDNEFYKSTPAYNPATGLGSLDASALAAALGVK
jgi:subtilase family serine protease